MRGLCRLIDIQMGFENKLKIVGNCKMLTNDYRNPRLFRIHHGHDVLFVESRP